MPSPCVADTSGEYDSKITMKFNGDPKERMIEAYSTYMPYRSVIGVSKDGRPIFSPYYDNGKSLNACDLDLCNGIMINNQYVYISTPFHPYFMGCYGPGPDSDFA